MKMNLLRYSLALVALNPLVATFTYTPHLRAQNIPAPETNSRWQRIETKDHDFSILMPTQPDVHVKSGGFSFRISGEEIKTDRLAIAYGAGVFYSVRVYETDHPTIALEELLRSSRLPKPVSKRDLTIDGFKGKEFIYSGPATYAVDRYFPTKKHLYVISGTARDGTNPALHFFLGSLRLGTVGPLPNDRVPPDVQSQMEKYVPVQLPESGIPEVVKSTEVDRGAIFMWKPDSIYSGFAILKKLKNPVTLRVVLNAFGTVTDVSVLEGDHPALHDAIVDSIKTLKFLPAEKNGRPVSTRAILLKYDFNASYHRSIAR